MTQKEAIKNIVDTFDSQLMAKHFVSNWLEDINWHTENGLLGETFTKTDNLMVEALSKLNYILSPSDYCESYVSEFMETEEGKEALKTVNDAKQYKDDWYLYKKYSLSKQMLREYRKAETLYQPLTYIFGWGINTDEWTSGGRGQPFVNELLEMVNNRKFGTAN